MALERPSSSGSRRGWRLDGGRRGDRRLGPGRQWRLANLIGTKAALGSVPIKAKVIERYPGRRGPEAADRRDHHLGDATSVTPPKA